MQSEAGASADVQTGAVVVALVEEGGVHGPPRVSPRRWHPLTVLPQGPKAALPLGGKELPAQARKRRHVPLGISWGDLLGGVTCDQGFGK